MSTAEYPGTGIILPPDGGRRRGLYADRAFLFRLTGDDTGGAVGGFEEAVPAGGGARRHVHTREDELISILAGEFTVLVGDARLSGGPGTLAFVPCGTAHAWRNCGDTPGRILCLFLPAGYERAVEAICELSAEERTPAAADRISQGYETFNVGPRLTEADR